MRIVSLTLRNFRGIAESVVRFSEGVTVVEGPNEVGKSSLAEAFSMLRGFKASSKDRRVKALQPAGRDVGPEVIAELRTGPYDLTYRQQWLRGVASELTVRTPRPEQLVGEQARARFMEILGETVDVDLLNALGVAQGESLGQPDLAQISSIRRALAEEALTGESDPAQGDALLDRVSTEYKRYFTPTGRPAGEFAGITKKVAELRAKKDELEHHSLEVDEFTEEHRQCSEDLERLAVRLEEAKGTLLDAEAEVRGLADLRRAHAAAEQRCTEAENAHSTALSDKETRERQVAEVKVREQELDAQQQDLADLQESEHVTERERAEAKTVLDAAERTWRELLGDGKLARERLECRRAAAQLEELERQLARARQADEERRAAKATMSAAGVDQKTLDGLRELHTKVQIARNDRQVAAARVIVKPLSDTPVLLDGEQAARGETTEKHAVDTVRVEVPGVAEVKICPGAPLSQLEEAVVEAEKALNEALAAAGALDMDDARRTAERRQEAEMVLTRAVAALEQILGEGTLSDLEEQEATVRARLETFGKPASGGPEDPGEDLAFLEGRVEQLNTAEEAARTNMEEAQAKWQEASETAERAREQAVGAGERLKHAKEEKERATRSLEDARTRTSDIELETALEKAAAEVRGAEEKLADATKTLEGAHPQLLEMRENNARDLVSGTQKERDAARSRVDQLNALLEDRARQGLYDKHAEARAALDDAEETQQRLSRYAAAADLLKTTLLSRKDEAQQKYRAPFRSRIEELGQLIFGGDLQIEIDEDLAIKSRTLGGQTVSFASLSGGAKEQLALLGRLAAAQLVAEDGGAPVILDDTLGFADPERLAALNVVLNHVGGSAQVILLTCQPDRFASLGGASRVRLDPPRRGRPSPGH